MKAAEPVQREEENGKKMGRVALGDRSPTLPQIRTCPSKRHPAPHLMTSLRRPPSHGPLGRGEDCIAAPDEGIWAISLVCLGDAETADIARSVALPPEIPEGSSSFH